MPEKEYIERETMLEYIDENIPRMIPNKEGKHPIAMEVVRNFIATFDTADVVPVKYGNWSHLGGDEFCCTNCGHIVTTDGSWEHPWQKFCPNCGAKLTKSD